MATQPSPGFHVMLWDMRKGWKGHCLTNAQPHIALMQKHLNATICVRLTTIEEMTDPAATPNRLTREEKPRHTNSSFHQPSHHPIKLSGHTATLLGAFLRQAAGPQPAESSSPPPAAAAAPGGLSPQGPARHCQQVPGHSAVQPRPAAALQKGTDHLRKPLERLARSFYAT